MKAQELLKAFEALDSEMLYAARADRMKKRQSFGKLPIAAAIVLLLISTAVLYGIFIAPASMVYLDSRESVTVSLNSRKNVLSANHDHQLDGRSAEYAVESITREMLDTGAINEAENTLILGTQKQSEKDREALLESVRNVFTESRFHGAIISLSCSDTGAKAEVINRLSGAVDSFSADSLRDLSANDLNLLLHDYKVSEDMELIGVPSEGMYIGKAAARARAEKQFDLTDGEITVIYSVYHRRMVYLVTIIRDDRGEAYFINAADGSIESAVRTTAEQIQKTIRKEVEESNLPAPEDSTKTPQIITNDPQTFETVNNAQPTTGTGSQNVSPAAQTATDPPIRATQQPTTVPIPLMTEKPKESPATQPQTSSQPEEIYLQSFGVSITYADQINLFDMTLDEADDDSFDKGISFTPLESYTERLNWSTVSPPIPKSQVNNMGKQDRYVAIYGSYADFIHDSFANLGNESARGEHLTRLIADYDINEDFFRENALLMVTYHDYSVYPGESDSICDIRVKGDTALVNLLRKNTKGAEVETDYYKAVMWAVVKKADVKSISKFQLFLTKQK